MGGSEGFRRESEQGLVTNGCGGKGEDGSPVSGWLVRLFVEVRNSTTVDIVGYREQSLASLLTGKVAVSIHVRLLCS